VVKEVIILVDVQLFGLHSSLDSIKVRFLVEEGGRRTMMNIYED
jgi:hypothetical protein